MESDGELFKLSHNGPRQLRVHWTPVPAQVYRLGPRRALVFLSGVANDKTAVAFTCIICDWRRTAVSKKARRWPLFSVCMVGAVGSLIHVCRRQVHALCAVAITGSLHDGGHRR